MASHIANVDIRVVVEPLALFGIASRPLVARTVGKREVLENHRLVPIHVLRAVIPKRVLRALLRGVRVAEYYVRAVFRARFGVVARGHGDVAYRHYRSYVFLCLLAARHLYGSVIERVVEGVRKHLGHKLDLRLVAFGRRHCRALGAGVVQILVIVGVSSLLQAALRRGHDAVLKQVPMVGHIERVDIQNVFAVALARYDSGRVHLAVAAVIFVHDGNTGRQITIVEIANRYVGTVLGDLGSVALVYRVAVVVILNRNRYLRGFADLARIAGVDDADSPIIALFNLFAARSGKLAEYAVRLLFVINDFELDIGIVVFGSARRIRRRVKHRRILVCGLRERVGNAQALERVGRDDAVRTHVLGYESRGMVSAVILGETVVRVQQCVLRSVHVVEQHYLVGRGHGNVIVQLGAVDDITLHRLFGGILVLDIPIIILVLVDYKLGRNERRRGVLHLQLHVQNAGARLRSVPVRNLELDEYGRIEQLSGRTRGNENYVLARVVLGEHRVYKLREFVLVAQAVGRGRHVLAVDERNDFDRARNERQYIAVDILGDLAHAELPAIGYDVGRAAARRHAPALADLIVRKLRPCVEHRYRNNVVYAGVSVADGEAQGQKPRARARLCLYLDAGHGVNRAVYRNALFDYVGNFLVGGACVRTDRAQIVFVNAD